jgi:hypothetical protein
MTIALMLRVAGGSLIVLSIFHAALWRTLNWSGEAERMSPLNARVFFVHTFFIAFVLLALGVLSLGRPDLLLAPSELARLLLSGVVVFWIARLAVQPLVFDRAKTSGTRMDPVVDRSCWREPRLARIRRCLRRRVDRSARRTLMTYASFDFGSRFTWLRLGIAAVWLLFGFVFKALGALPRHRAIVVRVVGEERAAAVLWLVALTEIGLASWMASGIFLIPCMAVQTAMIFAMNAFELRRARDLLVSPLGMVCANVVFLSVGWYVALARG